MPVQLQAFLIPRNGNTWFLMEDKYLKGGLQVVLDHAARDSINPINVKAGQLVVTQNDNKLWQLQPDLVTWIEFASGTVYNPFYTHKQFVPEATWTVFHNRNCRYFVYNIHDDTGTSMIADSVEIVDNNTITLNFIVPVAGHCTFSFDTKQD